MTARRAYPSDINDEERTLIAPYLTLLPTAAAEREHSMRDVFSGLCYLARNAMARAISANCSERDVANLTRLMRRFADAVQTDPAEQG